jgi:hypothetical protein
MTLEELMKDESIVPVAKPESVKSEIDEEIKKLAAKAKSQGTKASLAETIEKMMQEESFIIDVSQASIAGMALKGIKIFGDKNSYEYKVDIPFEFPLGRRKVTLAGLITFNNRRIALEVPAVKDFDRSGGVAAFYAAQRLQNAILQNQIDEAILIVPENTKGQKYQSILGQYTQIYVAELNNDNGEELVRGAGSNKPSKEGFEIAKLIFTELPDYVPEVEETSE